MAPGSRRLGPIRHVFGSATDRTPAMPLCEEVEFCRLVVHAVEKRKVNSKGGAIARMALDGNLPSMLFNNSVANRQTQPGAFPDGLGRKEGIENTALVFDRNTRPAVLKNDLHRIVMDDTPQHDRFLRARFDRIARIRQEIEKHCSN